MSSIVDYNKDSKLRYNRIYNTKATMLNDYTRNAIYKRTGCLDKFGFTCNLNKPQFCNTPYKSVNYTDANDQTNANLPCNMKNAYSDQITPPPVFMDKFYNTLEAVGSNYDINLYNLDIKNMTKTAYYNAVTTEQSRTNTTSLEGGLKGPIEFILSSKSDPEQTVHYWSTDNWRTTNEFVDKQQEGEHVYVTLRIHQATYSKGEIFLQAYSQRKGMRPSAISTHRFVITGYDSIFVKPENNSTIPYYIEYLTNWFDVSPSNQNQLYPPMIDEDGTLSMDGIPLTQQDREILANYITWLNEYAYNGPTSNNRDKLAVGTKESGVNLNKAFTYTYGRSPINPVLSGSTLDMFIKSGTSGWLQRAFKFTQDANIDGGKEFRFQSIYTPNKVDFRMNGDFLQYKTFGSFKLHTVIAVTNMKMREILDARPEMFATGGFDITGMNQAGGAYADNAAGSITLTSLSGGGVSDGWTSILSLKNTQRYVFYHYMVHAHTVIGTYIDEHDNNIERSITYELEVNRPTDAIVATYLATSTFTGKWFTKYDITDAELIAEAGVLGYNYSNTYTFDDGTTTTGTVFPTSGNVIDVKESIDTALVKTFVIGRVGYMIPETRLSIGIPIIISGEYGMRGVRIDKTHGVGGIDIPGENPGEIITNYYGYGYDNVKLNTTKPQGFNSPFEASNTYLNIPGLKRASDLIGVKVIRILENIQTKERFEVHHTIHGTFNEDENDFGSFYISFATVRPLVQLNDMKFYTHVFEIQNQSSGLWIDEIDLNAAGYQTYDIHLVFPKEYTTQNTSSTLKDFNYHPDGKSVILSSIGPQFDANFYSTQQYRSLEKPIVITEEYIKNPTNPSLLGDGKRKFEVGFV